MLPQTPPSAAARARRPSAQRQLARDHPHLQDRALRLRGLFQRVQDACTAFKAAFDRAPASCSGPVMVVNFMYSESGQPPFEHVLAECQRRSEFIAVAAELLDTYEGKLGDGKEEVRKAAASGRALTGDEAHDAMIKFEGSGGFHDFATQWQYWPLDGDEWTDEMINADPHKTWHRRLHGHSMACMTIGPLVGVGECTSYYGDPEDEMESDAEDEMESDVYDLTFELKDRLEMQHGRAVRFPGYVTSWSYDEYHSHDIGCLKHDTGVDDMAITEEHQHLFRLKYDLRECYENSDLVRGQNNILFMTTENSCLITEFLNTLCACHLLPPNTMLTRRARDGEDFWGERGSAPNDWVVA